MNRKRIYIFSLAGFFSMWGMFGFTVTASSIEVVLQETPSPMETTPVAPGATSSEGIPVTGEPAPVWTEIVVFYGLIGLTALFLILALLILANKSTVPHVEHKGPTSDKTHRK
jgi:hypothetical protein